MAEQNASEMTKIVSGEALNSTKFL